MNQKVFSQGSSADAVFYIQKGKVKITLISEQARKPSSRQWGRTNSAEGCLNGQMAFVVIKRLLAIRRPQTGAS